MADEKKNALPSGGHAAHKGQASKEKGKTGNKQTQSGVLLSTGGGEPIKPGQKWTDEKRVLQPRDPETGYFTYNSEAHWGLKYKQRNRAGTVPPSAKQLVLAAGINPIDGVIKKGDVIVWNGKTQIVLQDMSVEELYEYFRKYDENSGEYYVGKALKEKQVPTDNKKLSSNLVSKQGRHSKAENEGIAKGDNPFAVVGHYDMSKLSNKTAAAIAKKVDEAAKGFTPSGWSVKGAVISKEKYDRNKRWNINHPIAPISPKKPNPTGPANPPTTGGGDGGSKLVRGGKIDKSKVDYSKPEQKKFFDEVSKSINSDPSKYGLTPEQAGQLTGSILAEMAADGALDDFDWEE